ncbi:hypothetical protein D9757_012177 [Collybiopsis confluens]|uniref:Uncharacterized protein n=1 Tax=Collybiopsis confluens TaxID=2823264 RepID=A0A8H5LQQ9_9AGAR|nr:hypothetical protein D9757_012177 [Collybiopsis confluens]
MSEDHDILPGDIVAVSHGIGGRREGLVIGSHVDYAGRQILEVQLDGADIYHAWCVILALCFFNVLDII